MSPIPQTRILFQATFLCLIRIGATSAGLLCLSPAWAECPIAVQRLIGGLSSPTGFAAPPDGTPRLFVLQQSGGIRILNLATNTLLPGNFLTISVDTTGAEQGLLGMAFHPDYATNGLFFVKVTAPGGAYGNGISQIRRYQVSAGDPNVANSASMAVILSYDQPYTNHNGGWLAFGPNDGYLYIGAGDGGSSYDPGNRAQNRNELLGKILRIDVDGTNGPNGLYGIPADNPFVGIPNSRAEVWAFGLRNPWRCSFDRGTGDLYIGDVGQDTVEEIDFHPDAAPGGQNYGWRVMEGNLCSDNTQTGGNPPCNDPSFTPPIYTYPHTVGYSVTGGYVYRGGAIGGLAGTYFFADYGSARIWSFRYDGSQITAFQERTSQLNPAPYTISHISSFGEDANYELYFCDYTDGEIYKIIPAAALASPADLTHDCLVDLSDLAYFAAAWLADNCAFSQNCLGRDIDLSGRVDLGDYLFLARDWSP